MEGVPWKQQHMGTSRQPADSYPPKRISPSPPPQKHKKGDLTPSTVSPNLASLSYRTHSFYNLDSPALYWNLPPPTWNLNDDALEPPAPSPKKKKRRKGKQWSQPVEHHYTHTTFCRDPLCVYHQ